VVPFGDGEYAKNRRTLRLPETKLHKIDALLGFHPELAAFSRMYEEGLLTILQGVGYPNPSQDHGTAMRTWQTAALEAERYQSGWLGRAIDQTATEDNGVAGLFVGQIDQPFTLHAERAIVPSLRSLEDFALRTPTSTAARAGGDRRYRESALATREGGENSLLQFVERRMSESWADEDKVRAVIDKGSGGAEYPSFQFAGTLRTVAQLIRAGLGVRIYCTELGGNEPGGFDNHANQRDNHAALLRQLADSIEAFFKDLRRDGLHDQVLLMTFSEFGRTVQENGRRGTDHGSAAPLFLAGGRSRGGLVGEHPKLNVLENGGLKFHTDFRRVYATILDKWLRFDSQAVLGARFDEVEILKA
jgi:uncharacterized protein (DUF1501 family)